MSRALYTLIDRLTTERHLAAEEYQALLDGYTPQLAAYAAERAVAVRKQVYGNAVYIRGLIEVSNICKNDCLYCGIRRSNAACDRYRLSAEDILACCDEVRVTCTGGEVLSLDNGDPIDHTPFSSGSRRLFRGSLVAAIRKTPGCFLAVRAVPAERGGY